jgi:hypothetical protein
MSQQSNPTDVATVKPRCAWSGETGKKLKALTDLGLSVKGESIQLYALPEFEVQVRKFAGYYKRFQALFRGLIAAGIAGIFLAMFAGLPWLEPYAWFFVGVVLLIFPFANNPTFQGLNLRNSTRLARIAAVGCMGMGLFLFLG